MVPGVPRTRHGGTLCFWPNPNPALLFDMAVSWLAVIWILAFIGLLFEDGLWLV